MARTKKATNYERLDKTVVAIARRNDALRELITTAVEIEDIRFCRASVLARFLGYKDHDCAAFQRCINEAQITASNSSVPISTNFIDATLYDSSDSDTLLSEWAAYAVVMEADPRKENVAMAKNYFASCAESRTKQDEDRLKERQVAKKLHRRLHGAAESAGITSGVDHAVFDDHGYRGMYNMSVSDVERLKGVPGNEKLIDRADHTELAANNLRMSLTADKIIKDRIKIKSGANNAHFNVGRIVRRAVEAASGTPPEALPLANENINELTSRKMKELKKAGVS